MIDSLGHWLIDLMGHWLIDWFGGSLIDWLGEWKIDWLVGWLIDWLIDWMVLWIFWLPTRNQRTKLHTENREVGLRLIPVLPAVHRTRDQPIIGHGDISNGQLLFPRRSGINRGRKPRILPAFRAEKEKVGLRWAPPREAHTVRGGKNFATKIGGSTGVNRHVLHALQKHQSIRVLQSEYSCKERRKKPVRIYMQTALAKNTKKINQSNNQTINHQSTNQPINQSIDRQSINQSICRSINQSINQSRNQTSNQTINQRSKQANQRKERADQNCRKKDKHCRSIKNINRIASQSHTREVYQTHSKRMDELWERSSDV